MAMANSSFIDYDKIFLFGDSITEGSYEQTRGFAFAAALHDAYRRRLDVLGRGFSGYNTAHALKVLPSIIPPAAHSKIKLMTVFFGANDAVVEGLPQHLPLAVYTANLRSIVTHPALDAHKPKFLLIVPPPICEYKIQIHDREKGRTEISRLATVTKKYADAALQLGKELEIPTVNLWGAFMEYAGWKEGNTLIGSKELPQNERLGELLRDGLHFNPKAYEIFFDLLTKTVRENYPELQPEALPMVFPAWESAPKI